MRHFELATDGERLTLSHPMERRLMIVGCPLFLLSSACLMFLAVLVVMNEEHSPALLGGGDLSRLFSPRVNHFGFLWLIACVLLSVFIPLYMILIRRASTIFSFDKNTGEFRRHGKLIARLEKIEYLEIRRDLDPDAFPRFDLVLIHNDGYEMLIDESQSEPEVLDLADEIAEFIGVDVVTDRAAHEV